MLLVDKISSSLFNNNCAWRSICIVPPLSSSLALAEISLVLCLSALAVVVVAVVVINVDASVVKADVSGCVLSIGWL